MNLADVVAPLMQGAACRGHWLMFDPARAGERPEAVAERHALAAAACARCPALLKCRSWFDSLPTHKRPGGVVAGRIPQEDQ